MGEGLDMLVEAMFDLSEHFEKAAAIYIRKLNFTQAAAIMHKVGLPKLHAQYAKACEAAGKLGDAVKAYEVAHDMDSVVRLYLGNLNQPEKAFEIVRKTESSDGAQLEIEYDARAEYEADTGIAEVDTWRARLENPSDGATLVNIIVGDSFDNADVAALSLPALQSVGGYFYLYQNPVLEEVSAPGLETIGDYLYVDTNEGLTVLDFTAALTLVGSTTYVVGNTALCVPALDWEGITTDSVTISGNATCP